jgi:hypothetical protein
MGEPVVANVGVSLLIAAFVLWTTFAVTRPQSLFADAPHAALSLRN